MSIANTVWYNSCENKLCVCIERFLWCQYEWIVWQNVSYKLTLRCVFCCKFCLYFGDKKFRRLICTYGLDQRDVCLGMFYEYFIGIIRGELAFILWQHSVSLLFIFCLFVKLKMWKKNPRVKESNRQGHCWFFFSTCWRTQFKSVFSADRFCFVLWLHMYLFFVLYLDFVKFFNICLAKMLFVLKPATWFFFKLFLQAVKKIINVKRKFMPMNRKTS